MAEAFPSEPPDLAHLRVAVVGDLVCDHDLFARPTRVSREAPVLVMRHEREDFGAGGAANVARNLAALGAQTRVIGAVGRDASGRELLRLFERERIQAAGVTTVAGWDTPTKMRILGAEPGRTRHQVLRVDREPGTPLPEAARARVRAELAALAGELDALVVSDYGYGCVDEDLARAAAALQGAGGVVVLDPRRTFAPFRGVTALTPNLGELALAAGLAADDLASDAAVAAAAERVRRALAPRWLLVTLGNRGMALFAEPGGASWRVAASGAEAAVDVTGAGDTAAAVFALALAAGWEGPAAMRLANAASGVVVMENGAAVCTSERLRSALSGAPVPRASTLARTR
jgi:rfaE bifunctional protein kinase chain/domain